MILIESVYSGVYTRILVGGKGYAEETRDGLRALGHEVRTTLLSRDRCDRIESDRSEAEVERAMGYLHQIHD